MSLPSEDKMSCEWLNPPDLGNVFAKTCPSRQILKDVTSRWGVLVLFALRDKTHRFSELRRKINGISEKMLSQTLQALEADGFVLRTAHPVIPPHVDYALTDSGEQIAAKVQEMVHWIETNIHSIMQTREDYFNDRIAEESER